MISAGMEWARCIQNRQSGLGSGSGHDCLYRLSSSSIFIPLLNLQEASVCDYLAIPIQPSGDASYVSSLDLVFSRNRIESKVNV